MDNLFDQEEQQPFDENSDYEREEAPTPPVSRPKRCGLDRAKDALAMYKELQEVTIRGLYKDDPLIREGLNAQVASELMREAATTKKASNLRYDEQGHFIGINKSVMAGTHATDRNQKELLRAIQSEVYKKLVLGSKAWEVTMYRPPKQNTESNVDRPIFIKMSPYKELTQRW